MKSSEWIQEERSSVMAEETEMLRRDAVKMLSYMFICTRQHNQY